MKRVVAAATAAVLLSTASIAAPLRPNQAVPHATPAAYAALNSSAAQTTDIPAGTREGPTTKKKKRRLFGLPFWGLAGLLAGGAAAFSTDGSPSP